MNVYHKLLRMLGLETMPQSQTASVTTDEVEHINQELYKKSAELAERNKTLALLQKINGVVLGAFTKHEEIAQQVASLIVSEANFELVCVFVHDKEKNCLRHIGCSKANHNNPDAPPEELHAVMQEISLSETGNVLIQAVSEKVMKETDSIKNVLPNDDTSQADTAKSIFIYPLIVRNQLIGALLTGLRQEQQSVSEYEKDLIGRLAGVIGIALDNSLLYAEVQANNQRLKELDALKSEFVSVASHELRTPMTAIKSYLSMALDGLGGQLTEKQRYYIDHAYMSTDRLIKLVNDMLNISRIESGRLTITIQAVNIEQLVRTVIDDIRPRADELGIQMTIEVASQLPPVIADADKIKEVVFNLLGNSLKFTPKGGTVTVSFGVSDTMVDIKVKDTGTGIDEADIPKLFQKFVMLPSSYGENQAAIGTGLGLYICKSIIELHEGKIYASSPGLGKGSEFVFSLKIFNERDLQRISSKFAHDANKTVELIHSQL